MHLVLAGMEAQEHGHQLGAIEAIGLGPTPTVVDLAARLVTGNDEGIVGKPQAPLGPGDLPEQAMPGREPRWSAVAAAVRGPW
jgi:hypothetical protein